MNYRLVLYWLLSMLALFACLWFPSTETNTPDLPPVDLSSSFEVAPSFLYYTDNRFHAVAGNRLRIDLEKSPLTPEFPLYDTLVIEDLHISMNKTISLIWTTHEQVHRLPLNLTNTSVNRIDFKTQDAADVEDLHLLIEHNPEMGINHNLQDEVIFRSMYLTTAHDRGHLDAEISEWQDFTPVKFNSINGYTSADHSHHKTLIQRTALWLLICVLLYQLLRVSGHHLLTSIILGWVLTAIPYWYNYGRQHSQLREAFTQDNPYLNVQDRQAVEVATQIKQAISDHPELNIRNTKLVIVGPNEFIYLRLYYHLLDYDVAVHNNLSDITGITENGLFVFFAGAEKYCHKNLEARWQSLAQDNLAANAFEPQIPAVDMLVQQPEFCLLVTL